MWKAFEKRDKRGERMRASERHIYKWPEWPEPIIKMYGIHVALNTFIKSTMFNI